MSKKHELGRSITTILAAGALALGLTVSLTGAAHANEQQTGYQSCPPPNEFAWIEARTRSGETRLQGPGGSSEYFYQLAPYDWVVNSAPGARGGGNWEVAADEIDRGYTNTFCVPFTR